MFLKQRSDGSLVELISTTPLFDPFEAHVVGRFHAGEELQEAEEFAKVDLNFPSGEALPRCWLDPNYQRLNDLTKTDRAKADSDHQGPGAGAHAHGP